MNKLLIIDDFLLNIAKTGLFQERWVYIIAYIALAFEGISILLLLYRKKIGLYYSVGMMSIFTIYICILYLTDRYEVCGCGGVLNGLKFEYHLVINLSLLAILVFLIKEKNYED